MSGCISSRCMHSDFGSPYRNTQQSPVPDRPQFKLGYTITRGRAGAAAAARAAGADGGALAAAAGRAGRDAGLLRRRSAGRGQRAPASSPARPISSTGPPLVGNRMTSAGWEESARVVAEAKADATGRVEFHFKAPDDLGGTHTLWVETRREQEDRRVLDRADRAAARCRARPGRHAPSRSTSRACGWSETANIYTVVYDNATYGLCLRLQQPGRRRDHHAGDRRAGLALHRSLSGDLQGQGDAADQLPPAAAHLRATTIRAKTCRPSTSPSR